MSIINFPTPVQTNQELIREIAEISTLLEHLLDEVADDADLNATRDCQARDFFLLGRLLLLTRKQHEARMQAICARLGVPS